ncbi:MAG: PaaI family thioesterase [Paenisporosarcina sp.]
MNHSLTTKFEQIVKEATPQDLQILSQWLDGMKRKQTGETKTYLASSLLMDRIVTEDYCKVSIPITPFIHNRLGIPHGGIIAVILDTAMGLLANHSLTADFSAITTNLSVNYIAVATGSDLHANATFIHRGRQTMVVEGVVSDNSGKKLAVATGSFFVIPV